jgi:hypothetical protein
MSSTVPFWDAVRRIVEEGKAEVLFQENFQESGLREQEGEGAHGVELQQRRRESALGFLV